MLTNIFLIIFLILSFLVIIITMKKLTHLKNEQRKSRKTIDILCHDFKTSLTTLHLAVDGLKDYASLNQESNNDSGRLPPLLDILDDVGQSIAQTITKLSQQTKHQLKREGDSI